MSDMQWPVLPMPGEISDGETDAPVYVVLIEQNEGGGENLRWTASPSGETWTNRRDARAEAEHFAREYQPRHPMSERARGVFRISDDEYLTLVAGMTTNFSYRVTVAELI